jgi:hypothetical protein
MRAEASSILKSIAAVALLIAIVSPALMAQEVDAATAQKVRDYVYLVWPNSTRNGSKPSLQYRVDKISGSEQWAPLPAVLALAGTPAKGANIMIRYVNPFTHTWTTSGTVSDDPSYVAVNRFLETVRTFYGMVEGSAQSARSGTSGGPPGGSAMPAPPAALAGAATLPVVYAPILLEWVQWFSLRQSCFANVPAAQALANAVHRADAQVYGRDIPAGSNASTRSSQAFRAITLSLIEQLGKAESMDSLRSATKRAADSVAALDKANADARTAVDGLLVAGQSAGWNAGTPECANFKNYTAGTFTALKNDADGLLVARTKLAADLRAMQGKLDTLLMDVPAGENMFKLVHVPIELGKVQDVTLTMRQRQVNVTDGKLTVTDGSEVTTKFRVSEYQLLHLEFGVGPVLLNLRYPKFGTRTSGDSVFVSDAGEERQRAAAVGMLNIIPNIGVLGAARLMGQVGIGTGRDYPLILIGGGLRLLRGSTPLSVSVGRVWGWRRELKTLTPGRLISGSAELEKDLEYRLDASPNLFFGFQLGL